MWHSGRNKERAGRKPAMDAAVSSEFQTIDLTPNIGTEIKASVETLLSGKYAKQIRELLEQRGALVFRELNFTDEQQKAFTLTLGDLMLQRDKEMINITLDKRQNPELAGYLKGTFYWHIDMMNYDVPNLATLLSARKLSETGGETEFANTYAAWEGLTEDERREYRGLRVMHSLEASQLMTTPEPSLAELEGWRTNVPSKVQPLVWKHRSGRESLLIGATALYVLDKTPEESRYILTKLRDWATQRQFVYQHQWKPGDLVIWDNTGTMHRALPYPLDSDRLMRRTVLQGEEAVA
jgi:alpha-ketoglutarate-dependent taurine dioxygenase